MIRNKPQKNFNAYNYVNPRDFPRICLSNVRNFIATIIVENIKEKLQNDFFVFIVIY